MSSYFDIKYRLAEICNDLQVVLAHDETIRLWQDLKKIQERINEDGSKITREKLEVDSINRASRVAVANKRDRYNRDWYESSVCPHEDLSNVFLDLLKNQANVHIAKRLKFLKGLEFKRAQIETELYAYLYQNLRLYGHPITKTTKAAVRHVIDNNSPNSSIF